MGRAWMYPLPFMPIMPSDSAGLLDAQHKAARCRCCEGRVKPGWRREGALCQGLHTRIRGSGITEPGGRRAWADTIPSAEPLPGSDHADRH